VKGADVFLEALAELSDIPWSASILGDGSERPRLERMVDRLRLRPRVRFHGQVDDAASLFPAFDAFALSSRSEGTPMTLLEAIAAGVPVAATRVGGVPDVIGPSQGILVPPERPTALAQAIRTIQSDPAAAQQRAQAARTRLAVEFGLERWLAGYEKVYREITGTAASAQQPVASGPSRNGGRDRAP
jgi:glycosyltransferase involved in cell wall biosynthesis